MLFSFLNPRYYVRTEVYSYGLTPTGLKETPYVLVTHMFIHDNWLHFVANMLLLTSIGIVLEMRIGSLNFASLYFFSGFCGVLMNILSRFVFSLPNIVSIGSSACIFGIVCLGAIICGEKKIPLITVPILNLLSPLVYPFDMKTDVNLGIAFMFYIIFSILMMLLRFGNLMELTHFGGIIGGLFYFWILAPRKRDENQ
jgi:membrane associated rhomboid family serine protease